MSGALRFSFRSGGVKFPSTLFFFEPFPQEVTNGGAANSCVNEIQINETNKSCPVLPPPITANFFFLALQCCPTQSKIIVNIKYFILFLKKGFIFKSLFVCYQPRCNFTAVLTLIINVARHRLQFFRISHDIHI